MQRTFTDHGELLVTLLGIVLVALFLALATAVFGWHVTGVPGGYDIVADPAGSLPF